VARKGAKGRPSTPLRSPGEHILAMAVATLWISLGRAEAEDAERQALNNVQHEMTTCAAFYGIMHQCLATRTPPEDAPMFENMTSATAHLLKQMLSTGRAIGMTVDGITSGGVAGLVGIEGGVVSGVINLESSGVEAPDWRPRHDERYHEA
jgi:hypothetical protein